MKKELCMKAVENAYRARNPENGIIIHSDAGRQYTSGPYKELLGKFHAVQSMSDVAKCYDNSRMESWFATLKKKSFIKNNTAELTVEEVKQTVWRYAFVYYNRLRSIEKGQQPVTQLLK